VCQVDFPEFETARGGIWRICAVIDYATKCCLAVTLTPTSRGADALNCLNKAVAEATRPTRLADLPSDRASVSVTNAAGVELNGTLSSVRTAHCAQCVPKSKPGDVSNACFRRSTGWQVRSEDRLRRRERRHASTGAPRAGQTRKTPPAWGPCGDQPRVRQQEQQEVTGKTGRRGTHLVPGHGHREVLGVWETA
jgi:hypothetical protein